MNLTRKAIMIIMSFMALIIIPKRFFAQEAGSEPKIKIGGRVQMMLDTSFEDSGGIEGVSGDYRKNIPGFVFQRFFLNADVQVTPWLSGYVSYGVGGLDEASFTATVNPMLQFTAGWFGNTLTREGSTSGKYMLNESPEGLGFNNDNLLGLRVHGAVMDDLLKYEVFIGNAYTGGLPTKSAHFVSSIRTGFKVQYDVFQPWRHNQEQFYEDMNVSVSAYVEYAPMLSSRVGSLQEQDYIEDTLMNSTSITAINALMATYNMPVLSNTLPNPYLKKNFMTAGGSIAATYSLITLQAEGKVRTAAAANFAGNKLDEDYTLQYGALVDIITTAYNSDDLAIAGVVRFQYFNQPAGMRDDRYDTYGNAMQNIAIYGGGNVAALPAAAALSAAITASTALKAMHDSNVALSMGGTDNTLGGMFMSGSTGLDTESYDTIMRLSIGVPVYFKQHTLKIVPEFIMDITRDRAVSGGTSVEQDKNMVFRLGATMNF